MKTDEIGIKEHSYIRQSYSESHRCVQGQRYIHTDNFTFACIIYSERRSVAFKVHTGMTLLHAEQMRY